MNFGTDINVTERVNYNNISDPLNFHLAPSSAQDFNLSCTLVHNQIPAKKKNKKNNDVPQLLNSPKIDPEFQSKFILNYRL